MADVSRTPISDNTHIDELETYFPFGLHVSRWAWLHYGVGEEVDRARRGSGSASLNVVRRIADKLNEERAGHGESIRAGHLLTAGLLEEIFRYVIYLYTVEQESGVTGRALDWLAERQGADTVEKTLEAFVDLYPPVGVYDGDVTPNAFLQQRTREMPARERAFWEMTLLALLGANPAMERFNTLFNDQDLRQRAQYTQLVKATEGHFATQPAVTPFDQPLFELLRAPVQANPHSLEEQLEFILDKWVPVLPEGLVKRAQVARGIVREETLQRGLGPGPSVPLEFRRPGAAANAEMYPEPERFTVDKSWMANVVMLAKSAYVWLDQLSKQYGREIRTFDQVPDAELDRLARWGFNSVWLIGVWERSPASQWIKQRMGNPDAAASAYSLYDYTIAGDLGGQPAYENLRDRAAQRGIRLASDMVPNHVGIYSKWVVEHPDWFLQLPYPPFPGYTFNGPDLCPEDHVTIQIEDGYWDHSDASVVFKRYDHHEGGTRYIYHGNDGTSMPWNDTAQLDYLNPEVREAIIQTILHVARMFPIIRFDAAMTLAKKHYQRLWFPKPGEGGAIPSRAEFGMTRDEFDAAMPEEFWREVVDRVQEEAPDTLLLAEAFWLMEGYFVRTLGMHRVYNSAFMNMLKTEDNQKYRMTIKNVLEFSPEILKRFVNFMSNPDERTAIEQFGKDDKYFGCCMLLVTMPGLPMVGHGQVEGYTEKYGMEFRRAYWDEHPDEHLVWRHEQEIFPLMGKRYLFSGVESFVLYDFRTPHGYVNENVFAYSNAAGSERALVIYNNAYDSTEGWVQSSSGINRGTADEPFIVHPPLAESLKLSGDENTYYIFRDSRSGLEYIRQGRQLATEGLFVTLRGYEYRVLLDWREVVDTDGTWRTMCNQLAGHGTHSIEFERRRMMLSPLVDSFRSVVNPKSLAVLANPNRSETAYEAFFTALSEFLDEVSQYTTVAADEETIVETVREELDVLHSLPKRFGQDGAGEDLRKLLDRSFKLGADVETTATKSAHPAKSTAKGTRQGNVKAKPKATTGPKDATTVALEGPPALALPALWILVRSLGDAFVGTDYAATSAHWLDDWLLAPPLADALVGLGEEPGRAVQDVRLVMTVIEHGQAIGSTAAFTAESFFDEIFADPTVRDFLHVNQHEGVVYLNKEQLERLLDWLLQVSAVALALDATVSKENWNVIMDKRLRIADAITAAAAESGYRVEKMKTALVQPPSAGGKKVKKGPGGA